CVELSLEHMELFLLYRTQSIVSEIWDVNVTLEDVRSPEKQSQLFLSLLEKCGNFNHLQNLSSLLHQWPTNGDHQKREELWLSLLLSMIEHAQGSHDIQELINTFRKLQSIQSSQLEFVERIYQELADRHYNLACLKVALLTSHGVVHRKAFEFMSGIDELTDDIYDDELLELLIACDKVASFVNT
ncbi:neuroblastoma-amplified sequence-like, partial [Anneissia japonica]|uniref:neuroblastoma-amplified sequence-like n=1 Tax=Anneissia japonica TaxID=1529436 RepID=UPI00142594B6